MSVSFVFLGVEYQKVKTEEKSGKGLPLATM
jgi:hypothetical protein